jgi:hypothetical protein
MRVYVRMAAFVGALLPERQGMERETDAEEEEGSIVENSTHRQSAAHTDRHFCQQDPIRMEPTCSNTVSVRA